MAKLSEWEKKGREHAQMLADQLNGAPGYAALTHKTEREKDPDGIKPVIVGEPQWWKNLAPRARKHVDAAKSVIAALMADEAEDSAALRKAMNDFSGAVDGLKVMLTWEPSAGEYRLNRAIPGDQEEKYPFPTTVMALGFTTYWERYRGTVQMGVCHQCGTVYVKPKHGRKTRYCSDACRQKAFRERHKE